MKLIPLVFLKICFFCENMSLFIKFDGREPCIIYITFKILAVNKKTNNNKSQCFPVFFVIILILSCVFSKK